ncbi:MAG: hypothetical protein HC898_09735 [Phycisphaerales bacterium]|nr:hypothetical protein [Phycisphaerales bacterium]
MYNTPADFSTPSARLLVAHALGRAAAAFPSLDPLPLSTPGLDERDTRLALAIHHVAKQRWLTAEYMLDQFLRQPCRRLQSELRGVLMVRGGANCFF